MEWGKHALASLVAAIIATGAIYRLVPADSQSYALALLAVVAYLLGVRMPPPGASATAR
jgi:hypothetical protein